MVNHSKEIHDYDREQRGVKLTFQETLNNKDVTCSIVNISLAGECQAEPFPREPGENIAGPMKDCPKQRLKSIKKLRTFQWTPMMFSRKNNR